nr:Rtc2 [Starmerella bombicola]
MVSFDRETVSGMAGSVSLACWIIVFTPQIYENWRRQSSDGLSLAFVVIWLLGDLFNVFGALLQNVLPTMIVLAIYYTLADVVLLGQCLVYGDRPAVESSATSVLERVTENDPLLGSSLPPRHLSLRKRIQRFVNHHAVKQVLIVLTVVLCGVLGFFMGDHQSPSDPEEPQPLNLWGQILGWICAALYLASRVPQLLLNYRRKSTDGVAVLFFVFTLLGNVTYCLSIFAADSSPHAILLNASWIVGALGSLFLDLAVLTQFYVYRKQAC